MSVAHGALGEVDEAAREAERFDEALESVPDSRYVFNNTCVDILAIAREMMLGELAYRRGDHDTAFAHLHRSVELDDNLPYDEPWGWMQPTRHALGALLLEQGQVEEAAEVYRADLGYDDSLSRACQHPENVWSLHGYHECLERLERHAEAAIVGQKLRIAAARTDMPVTASVLLPASHGIGDWSSVSRNGRAEQGPEGVRREVAGPCPVRWFEVVKTRTSTRAFQ